eukprot:3859452-Rhodomonas_salina.3
MRALTRGVAGRGSTFRCWLLRTGSQTGAWCCGPLGQSDGPTGQKWSFWWSKSIALQVKSDPNGKNKPTVLQVKSECPTGQMRSLTRM